MSPIPVQNNWPELYRQAILESDLGRLPERIEKAQSAIQRRARELWYAGSPETRERRALDAAVRFLRLLKMVRSNKGGGRKKHRGPPQIYGARNRTLSIRD